MRSTHNIVASFGINESLRKREVHSQPQLQVHTEHFLFNSASNLKAYSYDGLDFAYYGYNASNTRAYKLSMLNMHQWVNGQPEPLSLQPQSTMFYPNAYINFNHNGEYTKHYYNGSERIASRLGDMTAYIYAEAGERLENRIMRQDALFRSQIGELVSYEEPEQPAILGNRNGGTRELVSPPVEYEPFLSIPSLQPTGTPDDIFYYHTNHLGSTAYVTDNSATITQGFLYAPFGEITTEYNANFYSNILPKYSFNAKELDEETGMYYYEARYYKPPVFTSRDPMFEKYFWMTPYAYCANNPVKYVDPSGEEVSTHTDENGRVIAVFDDRDNGVYMHGRNANGSSVTEYQITKRHEKKGTSAGGTYMGESLHSLSFVDQSLYNETGQIRPMPDMIIDFGSDELTTMANSIMDQNPSLYQYQKNAATNGDWDIKAHVKHGSMLYGKYASPRDAGNFVAGMVAASKGPFMEDIVQMGYGAYNLAGNNKFKAALIIFGVAGTCAGSPSDGLRLLEYVMNGEDYLSQRCIDLGKKYQRSKK